MFGMGMAIEYYQWRHGQVAGGASMMQGMMLLPTVTMGQAQMAAVGAGRHERELPACAAKLAFVSRRLLLLAP